MSIFLIKGGVQICKTVTIPQDYYQDLFKNIQGNSITEQLRGKHIRLVDCMENFYIVTCMNVY